MSCKCFKQDIIDIVGLCDPDLLNLDLGTGKNYWTQISIPENLIIPEQKPDIEQINSVKIQAKILRKKVIVTPISATTTNPTGENQEGKIVTGRKLIIEGELIQGVTYTADVPEQTLHTAHFIVPFSAFIVLKAGTPLDKNFEINVCIEDVFIKNICSRQIFKNVTLFLQAVETKRTICEDEC